MGFGIGSGFWLDLHWGLRNDVLFGYRRLVWNDRRDPGAIRLEIAGVDSRGRVG